jgi:hypothetical protein
MTDFCEMNLEVHESDSATRGWTAQTDVRAFESLLFAITASSESSKGFSAISTHMFQPNARDRQRWPRIWEALTVDVIGLQCSQCHSRMKN